MEKRVIEAFMADRRVAVAGASADERKFGHALVVELGNKGWEVFPVNPKGGEIAGRKCATSVDTLPPGVENLIVAVPAAASAALVEGISNPSIKRLWFLKGARSAAASAAARRKGYEVVEGRCPLMFLGPVDGAHAFHRFFLRLFGRMPA